jgi:phenylacetate-CoA ligase
VGEARFSRIASQFLPNTAVLKWRWRLWHHLVLPGNNLSDADHEYSWRQLQAFRPRVLFGVTSALTGLANFLEQRNLTSEMYPIDLVITWAGPAYEHDIQKLERIFQAPVSNIYSSRELGHIACRCPAGRLHVNEENYLVEIEPLRPEESGTSTSGPPGEILVTPLFPLPMPFIRYRTGDIGQWSLSECPCGRKQRVMDNLLGRSREVFCTEDGRMIAPNFWCHVFMQPEVCDGLEDFQVVLRASGAIRFRIVRTVHYTDGTERIIRDFVRNNLSPKIPLEFEYVSGIEPHPSGKFQMVVAESPEIAYGTDPVGAGA